MLLLASPFILLFTLVAVVVDVGDDDDEDDEDEEEDDDDDEFTGGSIEFCVDGAINWSRCSTLVVV